MKETRILVADHSPAYLYGGGGYDACFLTDPQKRMYRCGWAKATPAGQAYSEMGDYYEKIMISALKKQAMVPIHAESLGDIQDIIQSRSIDGVIMGTSIRTAKINIYPELDLHKVEKELEKNAEEVFYLLRDTYKMIIAAPVTTMSERPAWLNEGTEPIIQKPFDERDLMPLLNLVFR